jgi:hypothetical protein
MISALEAVKITDSAFKDDNYLSIKLKDTLETLDSMIKLFSVKGEYTFQYTIDYFF